MHIGVRAALRTRTALAPLAWRRSRLIHPPRPCRIRRGLRVAALATAFQFLWGFPVLPGGHLNKGLGVVGNF
jgi:hypothetical protein